MNLIDNRDVTATLVANPFWKTRVVEEITVDAATSCQRRRSLMVAPLRDYLSVHLPYEGNEPFTHALLALNVAPIPRGPLLDFSVSGPDGAGWLLPRLEIAARQALYLEGLAADCGHQLTDELRELITEIVGFTSDQWFADNRRVSLKRYIEDGVGKSVPDETLADWKQIGYRCRRILRGRLDVFRGYSAPESPALVLPALFARELLSDYSTATGWLNQYIELLESLNALDVGAGTEPVIAGELEPVDASDGGSETPPGAAGEFLASLADYANYYELVVAMRVPLDEPFLVKFSERRGVKLVGYLNRGEQELVVADAQSNHVTFKVSDPNVRIAEFKALKPAFGVSFDSYYDQHGYLHDIGSRNYSFGTFQIRGDQQNRSFYAHNNDRDYRIRLSFRLALIRRLQVVPYVATVLLLALGAALWDNREARLPDGAPVLDLRTLALIAGPAALAASVLLAREPSTLGSRLRLLSSSVLGLALGVLVSTTVWLYVLYIRC